MNTNLLQLYSDSALEFSQKLFYTIETNDPKYNKVKISIEFPTWNPIQNVFEDIQEMLDAFLKSFEDHNLLQRGY